MEFESVLSDDYLYDMLRVEIYRVCHGTMDSTAYNTCPYGSPKPHDALIATCKGCGRDTTELERAVNAVKDATLHLKHVTDVETSCLRKAVDSRKLKAVSI